MKIVRVIAAAATLAVASTAAFAQSPFGVYTRPSTGGQIEFYSCGGNLCAKVVKSAKKEDVGKVIMSGAAKSGDGQWKGELLNLEDGKTYSGVVTVEGPKAINLKGCVLGGIVCKGETWTR